MSTKTTLTFDEFKRYIFRNDEQNNVIKSHVYCEFLLNEIIKQTFSKPGKILDKSFPTKLDILESIGYIKNENYLNKLQKLNSIRNKYAHNYDYELSKSELDSFIKDIDKKNRYNDQRIDLVLGIYTTVGFLEGVLEGLNERA